LCDLLLTQRLDFMYASLSFGPELSELLWTAQRADDPTLISRFLCAGVCLVQWFSAGGGAGGFAGRNYAWGEKMGSMIEESPTGSNSGSKQQTEIKGKGATLSL